MWSGIGIGLYVLVISITGSIVVYRNELYVWATHPPIIVARSGEPLADEQLKARAAETFPADHVLEISRPKNPDQAVTLTLDGSHGRRNRLFNPYTGADLGDAVSFGIRVVSKLLELHDDLLAGSTGRSVNGIGGLLLIVLVFTGMVVWWPGIKTWRRSLTVHRSVGWRRFTWDLHSMIGFWSLGIVVLFALSGAYLSYPEIFQDIVDRIQPPTDANAGNRIVDHIIYWLAYLHFGRINGIGIPCRGPGVCDQTTKLVWAIAGLTPAAMFVTGTVMWWNRVLRKKFRRIS